MAGAYIFSGRRDPEWEVAPELGRGLAQTLASLPRASGPGVRAPPLGYRGVWLREPDGREWHVYDGTVTSTAVPGEHRVDAGRTLERHLWSTAPAGMLPPGLVN